MKNSETKNMILRDMDIERDIHTCFSEKFTNMLNV
jgi:hypothetical protein